MPHEEKHFRESQFLRDFVIGMSDGLTVPFALAAGLSGVLNSTSLVTTAGLAEVVAGSISMGIGGYLAGKTEVEHYEGELKREYYEVDTIPEHEKEEVREIFGEYDLSPDAIEPLVEALSKDRDRWVQFMMRFELGLERPRKNQAALTAATVGISYAAGGIIPLSPYFFAASATEGLKYSVLFTGIALFLFGALKSRFTGRAMIAGGFKFFLVGSVAAAAAYGVAASLS